MRDHAIAYSEPALSSDEGLPLANGLLGALVWGDGQPLTISLDRTDLWDLREVPEYMAPEYRLDAVLEKHRAGRHDELIAELEAPYHRPGPTKIPAGRIELSVPAARFDGAALPVAAPIGEVNLGVAKVRAAVHADRPVGFFSVDGAEPELRLSAPPFGGRPADWKQAEGFDASHGDVWDLGYAPPEVTGGPDWQGFVQRGFDDFAFAVALRWRRDGARTVGCWAIATSNDGSDPLALARVRVDEALAEGFDLLAESHLAWWRVRAALTQVSLPDEGVERAYAIDMYKFDAAARPGAPPISLQGPWTIDNGRLPPWKGDYHHNLNTQMSYWPSLPAGRIDEHRVFLDWLWDTRDACRDWTKRFFQVDGLNVPMTTDLRNRQIGGWRQYTHSIASGAWLAHHFVQHWRYTRDETFLRERGYPYVAEICEFIDAITETRDANGFRAPPISSSPEIHNNAPEAWFDRITNYDLALFRCALGDAAELADRLGRSNDAARWRTVLAELPQLAIDGERLLVAPGEALQLSHRHFSHLLGIHPLGLIDPRRSVAEEAIACASVDALDPIGTSLWMGYSFSWLACIKARLGDGDGAVAALRTYADGFLLRNSFHANGDFANKGYSHAVFRAFTLEGNFAGAQAVHEMLLQSHGGVIRLFPALPSAWPGASFTGLRAEGGVTISATAEAGRIVRLRMRADTKQQVTLAFGTAAPSLRLDIAPGEADLSADQLETLAGARQ